MEAGYKGGYGCAISENKRLRVGSTKTKLGVRAGGLTFAAENHPDGSQLFGNHVAGNIELPPPDYVGSVMAAAVRSSFVSFVPTRRVTLDLPAALKAGELPSTPDRSPARIA